MTTPVSRSVSIFSRSFNINRRDRRSTSLAGAPALIVWFSTQFNTMNTTRRLFILVAIPFTLVAPVLLCMEGALRTGGGSSGPVVFALCGGAYVYGSIFALRGQLPLSSLVLVGIILNILGACVWLPAFQFSDGTFIGLVGVGLTLAWLIAIIRAYREERH